jgi:hypothetical protein
MLNYMALRPWLPGVDGASAICLCAALTANSGSGWITHNRYVPSS